MQYGVLRLCQDFPLRLARGSEIDCCNLCISEELPTVTEANSDAALSSHD